MKTDNKIIINRFVIKSFAATIAVAAFALSSCDKDEPKITEKNIEAEKTFVVTNGKYSNPAVIDGITYQYNRKEKLSKAFFIDYSDPELDTMFSTVKDYPYNATANTYKVMKVWRKSEPGKYFWVMIENFRYKPGDSSYVYNNDEANAQTYGRFYHWEIANECAHKIKMNLPRRRADGTYTTIKYPTYGHLPSRQDINDIMEVTSIGHLPENGTTVFDFDYEWGYYDIFLSGREYYDGVDENAANHTMAGCLDNTDFEADEFDFINKTVFFWTDDNYNGFISYAHYPLEIDYYNGAYSAFINALHADHYGFSVRYVFEPKQL
ncbi:MAG: hypothetical protein IKQ46_08555 [Bacteroidales bacterium]|nr:hypothetical protein [Bacteroidales bacterium]